MRPLWFIAFLIIISTSVIGQEKKSRKKIPLNKWYDSTTFVRATPLVVGFGERSDELSKKHGGMLIFEFNDEYYGINCLADYYFWFTKKYEFLFRKDISIYQKYYEARNPYGMASFIKHNYKGKMLPVKFRIPYFPYIPYTDYGGYSPVLGESR